MHLLNKIVTKNFLLIFYKLLYDALFILLISLSISMLAEGLLPGIISRHIGVSTLIVIIAIIIILTNIISQKLLLKKDGENGKNYNSKVLLLICGFGIMLIINSMLKINFALNLFLTAMIAIIAYFFYRVMLQEE